MSSGSCLRDINRYSAIYMVYERKLRGLPQAIVRHRGLILVGILFVISVTPVLLVRIPAMIDYVNHLARMHLLVDAAAGRLNPVYVLNWRLYPNLAVDIVVPWLAQSVSVETATRLFLLASQALVVTGAIALEIAVRGRHQVSGFAALSALYSLPFLWGLLNFEFGFGLALWAIAVWIYYGDRPWQARMAIHTVFVVLLFVTHLFALGIYGLTIGCYEASRIAGSRQAVRTFALMGFPVLTLYLYLIWSGGAIGKPVFDWWLTFKLMWPLLVMNGYNVSLSVALALTIAALLSFLGYNRAFGLTRPAIFIGAAFVVAYLAMPTRVFDSAYSEVRLIPAMMAILPTFLTVSWPSRSVQAVAALAAITIILVNAASVASVWSSYRSDYAEIKESFQLLSPGSTILIARSDASRGGIDAPMYYAPTLAAHYSTAFVPSLYNVSGPIKKAASKSRFEIEDSRDYLPTSISQLNSASAGGTAPAHVRGWRTDYDYLYIVGDRTGSVPDKLSILMRSHRFALYAIGK
jgi:hypothetical protein